MAKIIDITDKLSFDENPKLIIKGQEIEVNADAPTMLKVMGLMGSESPGVEEIQGAYKLMFPEKSQEQLESLRLSFGDLVTVIQAAVGLIAGETGEKEQ